ncbi:hypothetical protein ACE1AT_14510 [Pelatocladus sp. BLCC-F211]|uniref:hypothetical protein n=1 Tax=Pelatocladus sp. BLCC-F211 TaxID=3342752 RepID=UPI0035BAD5D0
MNRTSIKLAAILASAIILSLTLNACDRDVNEIRVEKAEAIKTNVMTEEFPLPNCGGTETLFQFLGTERSVKKSATVGTKATTSTGGEVDIPQVVKLKLESQVELAHQEYYEIASSRLDKIEMKALPKTHVVYLIRWEEQKFASTVSYKMRGELYKAPYTYALRIPKVSDSYPVNCPESSIPPTSEPKPPIPTTKTVTMKPGTGFIFSSQKVTSGSGSDRDIWWNRIELVPNDRMYSLGRISSVEDIVQIASGEFKFDAFVPTPGEGFAVEIQRAGQVEFAILQIISVNDDITFEWLYPYKGQVTGR